MSNYIRPGSNSLSVREKEKRPTHINVNEHELRSAARVIQDRADMNENIMVLLPELKQAKEIIISSIISPNDFSKKELIADYNNSLNLPDTTIAAIKNIIEATLKRHKITDDLYDIAEKALFLEGAAVELIIPRSKVESIILHSVGKSLKTKMDLESFNSTDVKLEDIGFINIDTNKSITKIGKSDISLESFGIKYSGNPLLFATNEVYDKARSNIMNNEWYLDSNSKMDLEAIDSNTLSIYDRYKSSVKERYINLSNVMSNNKGDDVPFRMKLNSATVLPLYTDDKTKHLGYFALADEMNRAITRIPNDGDLLSSIRDFKPGNSSSVLKLMVDNAANGMDVNKDHSVVLSNMMDIAENILLTTINESATGSIYRNTFNIENENSLVRIMLYRALSNMQTSLIFIPVEYMSYIAFDYRRNGTGKTILEDISLLASFKSMLLLSEVYAAVDHNIPITDIVVDIDEKDPEPFKTKEIIEERLYNANANKMVWGSTDIEKHGSWIQNAGMRIVWNHKDFPDTKITMERKNRETAYQVDDSTSEKITGMILKALGLSPSILNEADNIEFASVAMVNNSLSNKINNERQDTMMEGISDLVKKLTLSDSILLKKYYELVDKDSSKILKSINDNIEDGEKLDSLPDGLKVQIVKDIIDGIVVRLPRAESKDRTDLADKFKAYMESINDMMDILGKTSYLDDVISELGVSEETIVNNLKLYFALTWCDEHNYARGMVKFMNIKDKKELKTVMDLINSKDGNIIELAKSVSKFKDRVLGSIKPKDDDSDDDDLDNNEEFEDGESDDSGEFSDGSSEVDAGDTEIDEAPEESEEDNIIEVDEDI